MERAEVATSGRKANRWRLALLVQLLSGLFFWCGFNGVGRAVAGLAACVILTQTFFHRGGQHRAWRLSPGYCYLGLFRKSRWGEVARALGKYPYARAVASCHPDYGVKSLTGEFWTHVTPDLCKSGRHASRVLNSLHVRLGATAAEMTAEEARAEAARVLRLASRLPQAGEVRSDEEIRATDRARRNDARWLARMIALPDSAPRYLVELDESVGDLAHEEGPYGPDGRIPGEYLHTRPDGEHVYTTNWDVVQPQGQWRWEGNHPYHTGPFITSDLTGDEPGFCYIILFKARYRVVVARELGAFPTGESLHSFTRNKKRWLRGGKRFQAGTYVHTIIARGKRRDNVSHIYETAAPDARHASAVIAHLRRAPSIGSVGDDDSGAEDITGTRMRAARAVGRICVNCDTLSRYIGDPREARLGNICCDNPWRAEEVADVTCLSCTRCPTVWAADEEWEASGGLCPNCKFPYLVGRNTISQCDVLIRGVEPVYTSIRTWGRAGEWLMAAAESRKPSHSLITEVHPGVRAVKGWMYRPDATLERSLENKNLHHVSDAVFNSSLTVAPGDGRRQELFSCAVRWFRSAIADMTPGDFVVVTAMNSVSDVVTRHPSQVVPGATRGVIFATQCGHPPTNDWRVILMPLKKNEGRLMAGFRVVPLIAGRTDLDFAIVNGRNSHEHPVDKLDELRRGGVAYGSVVSQALPVNFGAFFCNGCVFRADRREISSSFARYGHIYGWDESVVAVREPLVWVVNPHEMAFDQLANGVTFPVVTLIQEWPTGLAAFRYTNFTLKDGIAAVREGRFVAGEPPGRPTVNPGWASLDWAEKWIRAACKRNSIPLLGDATSKRFTRVGNRGARFCVNLTVGGECNGFGAIWRRYEWAAGLRDRLNNNVTQSLSPELWTQTHPELRYTENRELYGKLKEALPTIRTWAHKRPGVIAVQSVGSREAANAYRAHHSKIFSGWIYFSEATFDVGEDELLITLPPLYGSGNVYQLARLLPAASGAEATFSVINDLETDWLPRADRLAAALEVMDKESIVFPGMGYNAPCPFQDATYTGSALIDKADALCAGIARWGWVYGYDEVWCCAQGLPTVNVGGVKPGGACGPAFANPRDATVYDKMTGEWVRWTCPQGRIRSILGDCGKARKTPIRLSLWYRFKRAFIGAPKVNGLYLELEPADWKASAPVRTRLIGPTVTFVTWGTWGDRIPIIAGARALYRLTGVNVIVRHLVSLEEGRRMLGLCEADRAYEFLGSLASAAHTVAGMHGAVIAPDYLCWSRSKLAYSLRPGDADAAPPGGGLPVWLDWFCQLIYWKNRAKVRVGLYRGLEWFPRSADGKKFLKMRPLAKPGTGKRGVCIGSSTLPIPEEYAGWEHLPAGDHELIAQAYTTVVCDGGAGKVQTFRAAGVPEIISTNDKIDRKYYNPKNCGANCTGNEPDEKWALAGAYFYPELAKAYCGRNPVRWVQYWVWRADIRTVVQRAWTLMFFAYSFRNAHILPSAYDTVVAAVGILPSHWFVRAIVMKGATTAVSAYVIWSRRPLWRVFWDFAGATLTGMFHPVTSVLMAMRYSARTSLLVGSVVGAVDLEWFTSARIYTQFTEEDTGVWLIFSPVWVSWVPVGIHAAYYSPTDRKLWEGVHAGARQELAADFYFRPRYASLLRPMLAIRSELTVEQLSSVRLTSRPYSAIWNCQTMLLGVYINNARTLAGLEVLLLLLGSAWAFTVLLLLGAGLAVAASGTALTALVMAPLDDAFPDLKIGTALEAVRLAAQANLYWFAAEDVDVFTRDSAAIVAADAIRCGVDESVVFEAVADAVVASAYAIEEDLDPSTLVAASLFEERRGPLALGGDGFAVWVNLIAREIKKMTHLPTGLTEGFAAFLGAMLTWMEAITIETVAALCAALDYLDSVGLPTHTNLLADWVAARFDSIVDQSDRRKNVWAILSKKRIEKLRRADWLALSLVALKLQQSDNPAGWLASFLSKHHPRGDRLEEEYIYKFPSWLPNKPRASEMEFEYPSLLHEAETRIDPELTARVKKYLTMGGQVGIDGMWVATDEMREKVTSRYFSEPSPLQSEDLQFADEVARTLYALHPEAFEEPKIVRPETVRHRINMRGRSGIPFLQKVRTRRALVETGWMQAIISATYECIETGQYPPDAFSEFAKMMVLPADKLTKNGPRTIIATSLLNSFVNGVYELERRTRKVWPTTDMGMGAPMTARYMGEIFERISARNTVFSADMTAFDANIPPVIFEVLARLGELGATKLPVVGASLRTKYYALQNSHIYDLPTGKVWPKRRGGATGQSGTSWDNSWAMRAVMIACWSHVTGKDMATFYETNTVHNTGDDNVWGTDDNIDPSQLSAAAKELFGLDLRVEAQGLDNIDYLSKKAIPGATVADEILRVMDHVPAYTAVHSRERLLSRRAAVVSRSAGLPFFAYKRSQVERTVGHALLSAHDRPLYDLLANEWMEDARRYVGARNYAVVYEIDRDPEGHIEAIHPRFTKGYKPTAVQESRMKELTFGTLKLATYQRVLEAAYKDKQIPPLSKYATVAVRPSLESVIRERIVSARLRFHELIPDGLIKLAPTLTAAPYTPIFMVYGYPVEKFVWRSLGPDVDFATFAAELRHAPWAVATDPVGFWWYLEACGSKEKILAESELIIRGRMVVATLYYVGLTELIHFARVTGLGLLIEAWQIYTQDAPRMFALLDSLHWLETSRSSPVISSMTPKDPYATQKMVAMCLTTLTPAFICAALGPLPTLGAFAAIAELLAKIRLARIGHHLDVAVKAEPHRNRWVDYVDEIVDKVNRTGLVSVSAATSTGKSTELPALLTTRYKRVWIVVHTRYLRDTYRNPWVSDQNIIKLSAGVVDNGVPIAVCTYGHVCARFSAGVGPQEDDIVLLDEFHDRKPIQGVALKTLGSLKRVALSATPDYFYLGSCEHLDVPIQREFQEAIPERFAMPVMQLWAEAKHSGADTTRCLFILPSIKEAEAVTQALLTAGEIATTVTAKRRVMPPTGHIVATSVVEAGVNIEPPATCLIDSGLQVHNSRGRISTGPTTPDVAKQRLGRVGRRTAGHAFVNSVSGTGVKGVEYPTYLELIAAVSVRTWLLSTLGVEDRMTPFDHSMTCDHYMRLRFGSALNKDERNALIAWWLLAAALGSESKANHAYDLVALSGWPEELESVSNILGRIKWLPTRMRIQAYLDERPFEVIFDGEIVRPHLILLHGESMTWR